MLAFFLVSLLFLVSLGIFLVNLLFLGSLGIYNASTTDQGTYENADGLILPGGVMFLFKFIFEVLTTFLPDTVMKLR